MLLNTYGQDKDCNAGRSTTSVDRKYLSATSATLTLSSHTFINLKIKCIIMCIQMDNYW